MIHFIVDIALALFFLGVGLMFSNVAPHIVGFWSLFAAFIVAIIATIWQICRTIWLPRDKWFADSSYPKLRIDNDPIRAIDKNKSKYWRSSEPQAEDDDFIIDMAKSRLIASIEFPSDYSQIEAPKRWLMMFYGKNNQTLGSKGGFYNIKVESPDIPNDVRYIKVIIKEPHDDIGINTNYARHHGTKVSWTISHIKVKEYVFNIKGKKFWRIDV